jgi:GNAT superfamily N-acetyltransferase
MNLRRYNAHKDLDRCVEIWREASEVAHPFLDAATLAADADVIRQTYMPVAEITVAERGGQVIGFIALLDDLIGGLFVHPSHLRHGAGRALVADALARKGQLEVEVYEANAGARAFYTACGFVEEGRRETDDHGRELPLIRMALHPERAQDGFGPFAR